MNEGGNSERGPSERKLSPAMSSLRLLVLDFVREYIERWSESPSLGEIANALHTNRTRARKAVKSLAADGLLMRRPGPRGLTLPSVLDQAKRDLRRMGFIVDEDLHRVYRAANIAGVTDGPLLPPAELDYIPSRQSGDGDGQDIGEYRQKDGKAA